MTHDEAQRLWSAYQDGTLDRPTVRAFNQHLKECEACQARVRVAHAVSGAGRRRAGAPLGAADPAIQQAMAQNRSLLIKILILLVAAWAVYKLKR